MDLFEEYEDLQFHYEVYMALVVVKLHQLDDVGMFDLPQNINFVVDRIRLSA